MIKAGTFTIPGTSGFSVTGVGFKPQWAIFLFSNMATEGVWNSSPSAGISCAALQNSVTGTAFNRWSYSEQWLGGGVGYVYVGDLTTWVKADRSGGLSGWAIYLSSFDTDGFTFGVSLSDGMSGRRIYYLAGDSAYEEVGAAPFIPGSSAYSLGWQPQAFFGIGGGGGTGNSFYNYGGLDQSLPTVVAGDWGEYTDDGLDFNSVYRGIVDPTVDVQHWYGNLTGLGITTILEPTIAAGVIYSSEYSASRTDTSFTGVINPTVGFGSGEARMHNMILGSVDSIVGEFTPSTTVGVPTQVDLPFTPEAVVFFSPQEDRSGIGGAAVQGATGWGWCTETDQALLIYGGHWNDPNPFQSNSYLSSSNCWVGNCLDRETMGSVGTEVNMGSAQVNTSGFTHTTTAHSADPGEVWPVLYWAIAPVADQPQFFRRV